MTGSANNQPGRDSGQPDAGDDTVREPAFGQQFIDDIYDIALDPGNLDGFIDRLENEAADLAQSRDELLKVEALSAMFKAHLDRAEAFLDRVKADEKNNPLAAALASFDHCAALLVNPALCIVGANGRSRSAFGAAVDDPVDALPFEEDDLDQLIVLLRRMLRSRNSQSALIHMRSREDGGNVIVLHARWLDIDAAAANKPEAAVVAGNTASRSGVVLLASTELSWPDALDQTLSEVFGLTEAERDIVRALVEGKVLKTIARDRNRSLGTVRVQVKSILTKTRAHSQSELIRVTLSLMEVIKRAPDLHPASPPRHVTDTDISFRFAPYESMVQPDGRSTDYLVQGSMSGNPVIFSHMGYGLLRWPPSALALAHQHNLKVIGPVRPGFGGSTPVRQQQAVLRAIREDTAALMDHLDVERCPYVVQGNDMLFALDFALHFPERVSAIIGLGVRLPLPSDQQYPGMGKWHRFLLSNARHAPHLLYFTCKAAFTLGRKIGREELFRNVHKRSPADLAVGDDPELVATLVESSKLALSDTHHAAFAYATELLETESNWQDVVHATRDIPMQLISGMQDPLSNAETIAAYQKTYPWLNFELVPDAGQLLFFQKFKDLIPRIGASASAATTP